MTEIKKENKSMSNVPNLRFLGFDGEWEVKKLGEVANVSSGGTPSRANPLYWNGNIPWISTTLIDFNFIEKSEEYITEEGLKNSSAKLFPIGTLLMAMYGQGKTRGKIAILNIEATTNQACGAIITNKEILNPLFAFQNLAKRYDEIRDLSNQGGQENLSGGIIKEIEISFPTLFEQEKIVTFFSLIDERIATQNKLIGELKVLKSTMSKKIFSQELRFKDEKGSDFKDWQLKKLNEVCEIVMGQSPSSISYNTEEMGFPLIQGNADIFNRITNPRNWTTEITKKCLIGDLILTVRAPVGAVAKSVHNACIGRGVCAIRGNSSNSNEFIYQFLLDYEDKWSKLEQGSTFTAVSGNEIKKIEISIPCIEEQTKIANFLSGIDEKIEIEKQLLIQYENQKKYLLQNMFV